MHLSWCLCTIDYLYFQTQWTIATLMNLETIKFNIFLLELVKNTMAVME